jgi:hypothetical protein
MLAAPGVASASDPTFKLSGAVDYSTGKYGAAQSTDAVITPLTLGVDWADWTGSLVVPFAAIRGPGDVTVLADEGGEIIDTTNELNEPTFSPTQVRGGLSDISLSLTRHFDRVGGTALYFDATGRVRFPTGSRHQGLGVGTTDFFALGEVGGAWTKGGLYVDLGRRFLGDLPDLKRRDGWQTSVGGWWDMNAKTQLGLSYDWRAASVADVPPYQLVGGYASYRLSHNFKIILFSGAGFGSSSPGFDTSFTIVYRPTDRHR